MIAGAIGSLALLSWVAAATGASLQALIPFLALTASVLIHAPFSVGFHLFRGINLEVYNLWRRLDQIFIFLVSILLAFGLSWHVYSSWIGIALNTSAAAAVAVGACRELMALPPHFQRHRGAMVMFVGTVVMCYWFPMGYKAAQELSSGSITACAPIAVLTFAVLQIGGWVFAAGFPERFFPYTFDLALFSHQLMHVFACAAHVLEYWFVWELYKQSALHTA
eukprot:GHRR01021381.1.p1 GENE.GHRR01021381.1~~GHRR01021381.1.p1  ORF type:complete len:222 (+),score=45.85 GHRR01021381.1:401-1066(+)